MTMPLGVIPPSLQRTNSNGHMNIYVLVQNKVNDELLIVSRDNLPPTLRTGKLKLHQKITFRDEERNTIEGTIVYMNNSYDNCLMTKKNLTEKKKENRKENSRNKFSDFSDETESEIIIGNLSSKKLMKKTSYNEKKKNQSISNSSILLSKSSSNDLYKENEDDDEDSENSIQVSREYSLSSTRLTIDESATTNPTLPNNNETLTTTIEASEREIYLQKIQDLSDKLHEKEKLIKKQNEEIKRLRENTIDIPDDLGAQQFLIYLGDKVRQNTTSFKFVGDLIKESNCLGLKPNQLKDALKSKLGINSIARDLFKMMVPEDRRRVSHWNELKEDVLLQEELLINFLFKYFGPIQVNKKKIHNSLVGCLRNERNIEKKQDHSTIFNNISKPLDDVQNTIQEIGPD